MQVFLSFSHEDVELARKLQDALQRRNIRTLSMLDTPHGELWYSRIDQASSSADAIIFLLGSGTSVSPLLQAEWQALLRHDWESKKPLIPILVHGQQPGQIPKFLSNTRPIVTTNFDQIVEQVERQLQNPDDTRQLAVSETDRAELQDRLEHLKTFAEALKSTAKQDGAKLNL